jgi:thymidylate kinase
MTVTRPRAVALEGTNGAGKTYLARRAAALAGPSCHLAAELPDSAGLPAQVVTALRAGGDPFLRTGAPRTETLLLAALQVHRMETLPALPDGTTVLEDRGPLSVAVYQAVILHPGDPATALAAAEQILALIGQWRPLPHALLLIDDPRRCRDRFTQRSGRPPSPGETRLMTEAAGLYELIAARSPRGITILDRRELDEDACASIIARACAAAGASPAGRHATRSAKEAARW